MSEEDPTKNSSEFAELTNEAAEVLGNMKPFEEHMADMQNENREQEQNVETEKSPEERQVEDLEVLFSFCDEKDILDILKSDSYGALLENNVSLVDLFNANALFDEQYFDSDGYTTEYDIRNRNDNKLEGFTENRRYNIERKWRSVDYKKVNGDWEESEKVRNDESGPLAADKIRAGQAKDTINEIAYNYLGQKDFDDAWKYLVSTIKTKAAGEELTEEQKEFLSKEHSLVTDRLLYGGKVVNKERADSILKSLSNCESEYQDNISSEHEYTRECADDNLVDRFIYAEASINDYLEAGKSELVADSISKLKELVDKHFDKVANYQIYRSSNDYDDRRKELILNYSDPFKLVERMKEHEQLTGYFTQDDEAEGGGHFYEKPTIDPDLIVETVAQNIKNHYMNPKMEISYDAKDLVGLGATDEVILKNCGDLSSGDFIGLDRHFDGVGSRLIEAGLSKNNIIKEVFNSGYWGGPFEKKGYPYNNESDVEVLERNGFDITDIAETFDAEAVGKNLTEFVERGADAKELMKYMMSYHEEFEGNIAVDKNGKETGIYYRMWFPGLQNMMVWDKNHPEGKMVKKNGMHYHGIDYVAANFDILADNGVKAKDIIDAMPGIDAGENRMFIPRMLECGKFNSQEVLSLAHKKYVDFISRELENGYYNKDYVERYSNERYYYSKIIEQLTNEGLKEIRDNHYNNVLQSNA